jgi:murein DD-endopeptidase MepM/ murein hydrolase activator NlpD
MLESRILRYSAAAAALAAIFILALVVGRGRPLYQAAQLTPSLVKNVKAQQDDFGISSSFDVIDRKIQRNETFAEMLTAHNIPYSEVVELAESALPVFDVRAIRAGSRVRFYRDSLSTARYVVYQSDAINYVVFDLTDESPLVYERQRPVQVERRRLSGVINGSLYETLSEVGASGSLVPLLATELSEVFAWQIDFYRIQAGDEFSVLYEERSIDGEPIGMGKIVAARFVHGGENFYGIYFDEAGRPDYYDDEGNSLRKAFLKAPLKYSRISSRYTKRRFHPVQKRYKPHLGTDYAADSGTPIRTVGDGVVMEAQFKRNNGNYVKIRHNGTYTTGYLHMSRIGKGIRPGVRVEQGDVIGYVGSTGLATGPHLCYRFWKNGVQVDPLQEEIPTAHPIEAELRDVFFALRDEIVPQLVNNPEHSIAAIMHSLSPSVLSE